MRLNPKDDREIARRYSVLWTPTLVFEHFRGIRLRETVGYLPPRELLGELQLARGLFAMRSARHSEAAELFTATLSRLSETAAAPEALYWLGTTYYFRGDKAKMWQIWQDLTATYPKSLWALKTTLGADHPSGEAKAP